MLPLAELFQFLFPLSVPVGSRRVIVIYGGSQPAPPHAFRAVSARIPRIIKLVSSGC